MSDDKMRVAFESAESELTKLKEAYDEGTVCRRDEIVTQLLELPGKIQAQSFDIAKTAELIECQRLILDRKKNDYLNFVLSATMDGKPKFSNELARRAAVESLIVEDKSYVEIHDSLVLNEALLKRQEIELTHLNNLFRVYLAIAGMGVR